MRSYLALSLSVLLFGSSCYEEENLYRICPSSCWDGRADQRDIGICHSGVPECDERGEVIACNGQIRARVGGEICNGLDDDCDGEVDENLRIPSWDADNGCLQCGVCRGTTEVCVNGNWYCDYETPPAADDATCNGVDEDCDCQTDEDWDAGEDIFCYDHEDPETALCGECRPGIQGCVDGQLECAGATYPTWETCNGRDDDCNCFVDDIEDRYNLVDIVFSIDTSGSMSGTIDSAAEAMCLFAQSNTDDTYHFALVLIATPDGDYSVYRNFGSAQDLCDALQELQTSGGNEPTITANRAVVDPTNPLMLDWRPEAQRVFIGFGDEYAQVSECDNEILDFECLEDQTVDILAMCPESETTVYWFVGDEVDYYVDAALGCGGEILFLVDNTQFLVEQLNSIFEELCVFEDSP